MTATAAAQRCQINFNRAAHSNSLTKAFYELRQIYRIQNRSIQWNSVSDDEIFDKSSK